MGLNLSNLYPPPPNLKFFCVIFSNIVNVLRLSPPPPSPREVGVTCSSDRLTSRQGGGGWGVGKEEHPDLTQLARNVAATFLAVSFYCYGLFLYWVSFSTSLNCTSISYFEAEESLSVCSLFFKE